MREQQAAQSVFPTSLFSLEQEPLAGEISRNEETKPADPDRHSPLSHRHFPTVEEPQRVDKGDECEDRAGHEQKGSLLHQHSFISTSACSSQKRMSISRYIAVAVARSSRACSCLPVRR